MARRKTRAAKAEARKKLFAVVASGAMLAIIFAGGWWYVSEKSAIASLDDNLCPPEPTEYTMVLVDVTDPLTLPQRQDLRNKLDGLKDTVSQGGKVAFFKVGPATDELLTPLLEVCNPGTPSDFSEMSRDLKRVKQDYEEGFETPFLDTYEKVFTASGGAVSPIIQSIQSVNLTELDTSAAAGKPRRLIVISDLLQNTDSLSFYGRIPAAEEVMDSPDFRVSRTNLSGVQVELWMLQRADFQTSQPRSLPELWTMILREQGARRVTAERISG